jgi:tetratricopeptide (TPR) repeat protein
MNKMQQNKAIVFITLVLCFTQRSYSQSAAEIVNLIQQGKLNEARSLLLQNEDYQKPSDLQFFIKGLLSTDSDSAAFFYTNVIQTYPESPFADDALLRLSQMKYAMGLYKTAQSGFLHLLRNFPSSSLHQKSQFWTGLCFQAMDQPDSALACFQRVIDQYPSTDWTMLARNDIFALKKAAEQKREEEETEPSTKYYVQVGAFLHQPNALLRKSFFENRGYPVALRSKIKDDKTYYLVWIGYYKDRDEARLMGEKLKKSLGIQYSLVIE